MVRHYSAAAYGRMRASDSLSILEKFVYLIPIAVIVAEFTRICIIEYRSYMTGEEIPERP